MEPLPFTVRPARAADIPAMLTIIDHYASERKLLPRASDDLQALLPHAFVAESGSDVVGCAALEIYSGKFSEIHCLAVAPKHRGTGIGRQLVAACVHRAQEQNILEVMTVSSDDRFLKACGFDYSLPTEKKALFAHTAELDLDDASDIEGIRRATPDDTDELLAITSPFVQQKKLLPRSHSEMAALYENGFVAVRDSRLVGCCALEIYSSRMAELLCLAVAEDQHGRGIGLQLVRRCLREAQDRAVREVLAISASEQFLQACGFHFALPDARRALILQTRE